MIETRQLVVTGIVQGVWYRKFVSDRAHHLGLQGWVRNVEDGSVEIVVRGDRASIAALESHLWQGTPLSDVQFVENRPSTADVGEGFLIF